MVSPPRHLRAVETDVDIDLREIYFLIMHFLSVGPCRRTFLNFKEELLEHQLLPRRYHAWFSRSGEPRVDDADEDDGISLPLDYSNLVGRYFCIIYAFWFGFVLIITICKVGVLCITFQYFYFYEGTVLLNFIIPHVDRLSAFIISEWLTVDSYPQSDGLSTRLSFKCK